MYIPLTFPKYPLINDDIVHVWCIFSGKSSNILYQAIKDELWATGIVISMFRRNAQNAAAYLTFLVDVYKKMFEDY